MLLPPFPEHREDPVQGEREKEKDEGAANKGFLRFAREFVGADRDVGGQRSNGLR